MEHKLWIDGKWVDSKGGGKMAVENPATGKKIAEVVDASPEDVNRAVQAAVNAFADGRWSRLTPAERSKVIWKLADLLEKHAEEFAKLETENTGKPYKFVSLGSDLMFSIDNLRFFAGAARDTHGSHAGEYWPGYTSIYRREPVGPVGQIAPWNYPLMMGIWKIGPALAAGCTTVFKPASLTPLTSLMLADIIQEAGIPDGVVNIITGRKAGQLLVEHPDIRMISVTGSTEVGQSIMRAAAASVKRLHLELGGKAPVLVFEDADVDLVAAKVALAGTINSGQDCTAATRVYVQSGLRKKVEEALVEAVRNTKIGEPFADDTLIGPMISAGQRESVNGFVERARKAGAKVLTGGRIPKDLSAGILLRADRHCRRRAEVRDHPERGVWAGDHDQFIQGRSRGHPAWERRGIWTGLIGVHPGCWPLHARLRTIGIWNGVGQRSHSADLRGAPRGLQTIRVWQGPLGRIRGRLSDHQARDDRQVVRCGIPPAGKREDPLLRLRQPAVLSALRAPQRGRYLI